MSAPLQHAALLRIQGIDVSGTAECLGSGSRVGKRTYGGSAVLNGNTGGAAFQLVNGHGERRAEHRCVVLDLTRQLQLVAAAHGYRRTQHTACVFQHEIDLFGSDFLGSHDEVALILAVFVVNDDDEFAGLEIPDSLLYRIEFDFTVHIVYR